MLVRIYLSVYIYSPFVISGGLRVLSMRPQMSHCHSEAKFLVCVQLQILGEKLIQYAFELAYTGLVKRYYYGQATQACVRACGVGENVAAHRSRVADERAIHCITLSPKCIGVDSLPARSQKKRRRERRIQVSNPTPHYIRNESIQIKKHGILLNPSIS